MMKILLYVALAGALALGAAGCRQKDDGGRAANARALFERSVRLNALYTDSLRCAGDSATILRLSAAYDDALTHLNFEFPAETDPDMTEGENDTLITLTRRFVTLRDSMLYRLAHPLVLRADSVAADSLARDSVGVKAAGARP